MNLKKLCYIHRDFVSIKPEEAQCLSNVIRCFDDGERLVVVQDDEGEYHGYIAMKDFVEKFPKMDISLRIKPYLCMAENEDADIDNLINEVPKLLSMGINEIPFIQNGKVVKIGEYLIDGGCGLIAKKIVREQKLYWDCISDEIMSAFLKEKKKILISSQGGVMKDFYEKFKSKIDITVYNDDMLIDSKMTNEFDLLIFDAELWDWIEIEKYQIRLLYMNLLAEELKKYYEANGVTYIYYAAATTFEEQDRRIIQDKRTLEKCTVQCPRVIKGGMREDYLVPEDVQSQRVNVVGNCRVTPGNNIEYKNSILFFGPCIVFGTRAIDSDTIESRLQRMCNNNNLCYNVRNLGFYGIADGKYYDVTTLYRMMDTYVKRGDIVIQFGAKTWLPSSPFHLEPEEQYFTNHDAFDIPKYRKQNVSAEKYVEHSADIGYEAIAELLYTSVVDRVGRRRNSRCSQDVIIPFSRKNRINEIANKELKRYIDRLASYRQEYKNVGSIVMNANPFTKGHMYLIDKALDMVDYLFVFIVEEDKSEFSFDERYEIVTRNLRRFKNVCVLPSGKYIISSMTFAAYFEKEDLQDRYVNPSYDVRLFGDVIAPALNITKRFVGSEPIDKVTRQYNLAMKMILPEYGVDVVEIPRLETDGEVISASKVRKIIGEHNYDGLEKYLTNKTLEYLREVDKLEA